MGKKAIVVLLVCLVLAFGYVASGASRDRPCRQLRIDMSVSNEKFERECHARFRD
jgi:hypothetical protein